MGGASEVSVSEVSVSVSLNDLKNPSTIFIFDCAHARTKCVLNANCHIKFPGYLEYTTHFNLYGVS